MKLFDIIDETAELLLTNKATYFEVEEILVDYFEGLVGDQDIYIGNRSRVKSEDSLRSKIVRNKYYLKFKSAEEIINHLSDVVGITIECRFKSEEEDLFRILNEAFKSTSSIYSISKTNEPIYLNLQMQQPQKEKNGFETYRLDGYYMKESMKINFELQIKSLVHTFWSGVEHEVIYKSSNYYMFDGFLKELLHSVKANLDVVDMQLSKIYEQMTSNDDENIGMNGANFKAFLAKSINDIYSLKLKNSVDIEADIKKMSALLSHYIYLNDFVRSKSTQSIMLHYFEHMNYLMELDVDFTDDINSLSSFKGEDSFTEILGRYIISVMNTDFDWHVLFVMLFTIQSDGDSVYKYDGFIRFIKELLFSPTWFKEHMTSCSEIQSIDNLEEDILSTAATALVKQKDIDIVYEESLYLVMLVIRDFIEGLSTGICNGSIDYNRRRHEILDELNDSIEAIFN